MCRTEVNLGLMRETRVLHRRERGDVQHGVNTINSTRAGGVGDGTSIASCKLHGQQRLGQGMGKLLLPRLWLQGGSLEEKPKVHSVF